MTVRRTSDIAVAAAGDLLVHDGLNYPARYAPLPTTQKAGRKADRDNSSFSREEHRTIGSRSNGTEFLATSRSASVTPSSRTISIMIDAHNTTNTNNTPNNPTLSAISNALNALLDTLDTQEGVGVESPVLASQRAVTPMPYAISNVSNQFAHLRGCAPVFPYFSQGLRNTLDTLDTQEGAGVKHPAILGELGAVCHIQYPVGDIGYAVPSTLPRGGAA